MYFNKKCPNLTRRRKNFSCNFQPNLDTEKIFNTDSSTQTHAKFFRSHIFCTVCIFQSKNRSDTDSSICHTCIEKCCM